MSTYTDLHNQIKETLVVGYRPDDRMTTQKVKFVNKENEYWGTFKGTIVGEDPTFNGGTFNEVDINDSKLKGVTLETTDGHKIDLDSIADDIQQMSQDVDELKFIDESLSNAIDNIAAGIGGFDGRISAVEAAVRSVRSDLSAETSARISADITLSNDLIDELTDVSTALNNTFQTALETEMVLRKAADQALADSIDAEEEARVQADTLLSDTLSVAFEQKKHYELNVIDITERPYQAKEFAVNILKTSTSDAAVYDSDGKTIIGRIDGSATGKIDFIVNSNVSDKYKIAIVPGQTYTFDVGTTAVYTVNGYQLILTRAETLDAIKLTLKPTVDSYYPLVWDKGEDEKQNVGIITNGFADATSGMLISGYVTIDTTDTTLTAFKCLYEEFNKDSKTEISVENNVIKYLGDNVFSFEKNIQVKNYMQLLNVLSSDEMFGKVYEYDAQKDATGKLTSIKVKLLDLPYKLTLDNSNSFKAEVSNDVSSITFLSITADEEVLVKKEAVKHQYDFYVPTIDAIEHESWGKVILDWNTMLSDDFDTDLSIDLSKVEKIEPLKKTYTLKKNDAGKWETTQEIDGHSINIIIDKDALTIDIKIVTADEHALVTKHFMIDADSASIAADESVVLAKTAPLTYEYPESESSPESAYRVLVGSRIDVIRPKFVFECTTSGADDVKIVVPDKDVSEISREMLFVVKVTSGLEEVKLHFVDTAGNDIKTYYKRTLEFKIPTNVYSTVMLREVQHDVFMLFDLNENSQDSKIEKLQRELDEFEDEVNVLSGNISSDIETLSANLSIDIDTLSTNLSSDINKLSADLSGEVISLSTSISCAVNDICTMLSGDMEHVSADVIWLSSEVSDLIDRDNKDVTYCGNFVSVDYGFGEHLSYFLRHQPFCYGKDDYVFKHGNMYHLSAAQANLSDAIGIVKSFNNNDVVIFNKDVALSDATYADFEIVRDYDVACENFAKKDDMLSAEIESLSNALSIDIDMLSSALSNDINRLSTALSIEIQDVSNDLSLDINSLSDRLSIDIQKLSTSLSDEIRISVNILADHDSAQDDDIMFISSDLSALEHQHYNMTFNSIDRSADLGISADNLVLTDTVHRPGEPHDRYYLTFEYGTMVLKKFK